MFRSIQTSFAALAGACTLAIIAALLLYAMVSGMRTQELVEERTRGLIEGMAEQRVTALAQWQVSRIQAQLQEPLQIAIGLARVNALPGMTDDQGMPMANLTREELINLARETLLQNPALNSTFIAWEPNGVDANDVMYRGDAPGMLNGRFASWLYRDNGGSVVLDRLTDIEDTTLLETGVRAGEYYLCPREHLKSCVGDPAPYEMNGEKALLSSFSAPIIIDGKFQGIVGADIRVDFIQQLLGGVNDQLYGGVGKIALISGNGHLAAYSHDAALLGKPAAQILAPEALKSIERLPVGQVHYQVDETRGLIEVLLPFSFTDTDARWVLMLELPLAVVMQDLEQLITALAQENHSSLAAMLLIGLLIAMIGLAALWLISRRITRPLRDMVAMLDDIGQGEGDLTQRLNIDSRNELGQIAAGFNAFLARLQGMIGEVVGSVQQVSDASEHTADIAIRTDKGVQTQLAEIEQVATAVHQMTATAQDVARNASQAAEAANNADRAANQGRHIVQDTGSTITELAGEIGRAVDVVQALARDSENIDAILVTIRSIAEQTNLLALNAAIEAARAGEHGRGFAVVADEVRKLAERTTGATKEIGGTIESMQSETKNAVTSMKEGENEVELGTKEASKSGDALKDILKQVNTVTTEINQIAVASEEQTATTNEIATNIQQISGVMQDTAKRIQENAGAATQLANLSKELQNLVGQFRV